MANTYTQIHLQLVFSVQDRNCIIREGWKNELYKYITGIVKDNGHKLLIINGMPDHIHMLCGIRPSQSVSEFMQNVKCSSSKWINEKMFIRERFSWQEGFGAFSYSRAELSNLIGYIQNQEEHHKRKTFREEYLEFLKEFKIEFNERFIFKSV